MENYNSVPNVITGKDLDYLSDMFNWNYGAYKCTRNSIENIKDDEIKKMIEKTSNLFHNNMTEILNILGGSNE